jgi:hypothetical protein
MSCDRIDSLLSDGAPLDAGAKEHIAGCASCRSMITILGESGGELGPEEVGRLKTLVSKDWRPVRPLPSDRKLVALLLIFFVSFSVLAAWPTRYYGLRGLNATQMAIYFSVIACCAFLGALAIIQEMIPGSRKRISPVLAMALAIIGLIAVIVVLFPNFSTSHFVRYGEGCFRVGSVCGLLAGLLLFLALRTGFFASPVTAAISVGFSRGTFRCGRTRYALLLTDCASHSGVALWRAIPRAGRRHWYRTAARNRRLEKDFRKP